MIYYTTQISFFIAGTIRENLLYGLEDVPSDKELIKALKRVNLVGNDHPDTVICTNPEEALDFSIGEKAEELSGGMKQRLSLARAYLRRPKIFVFDEITANMDSVCRDLVLSNFEEYAKEIGAGIIYISHDRDVIDRCNYIIRLKNNLKMNEKKRIA